MNSKLDATWARCSYLFGRAYEENAEFKKLVNAADTTRSPIPDCTLRIARIFLDRTKSVMPDAKLSDVVAAIISSFIAFGEITCPDDDVDWPCDRAYAFSAFFYGQMSKIGDQAIQSYISSCDDETLETLCNEVGKRVMEEMNNKVSGSDPQLIPAPDVTEISRAVLYAAVK